MSNLKGFAEKIRADQPEIFGEMQEARTVKMVRAVLKEIGVRIDQLEEGVIAVPLLGRFVVKKVTPTDKPARRHIVFRRAAPKSEVQGQDPKPKKNKGQKRKQNQKRKQKQKISR